MISNQRRTVAEAGVVLVVGAALAFGGGVADATTPTVGAASPPVGDTSAPVGDASAPTGEGSAPATG